MPGGPGLPGPGHLVITKVTDTVGQSVPSEHFTHHRNDLSCLGRFLQKTAWKLKEIGRGVGGGGASLRSRSRRR